MTPRLLPCPLCGSDLLEVDPGLDGVPESGGFVICPTIWMPDQLGIDWTVSCPAHAENAEAWNALCRAVAARRVRADLGEGG